MNQQKALQLLNTIMPDISTSGDPGSVMLKCARKNNLAPAQLEKLAQVFNTMKTNYFMDHQSNRGDSFSLVNVPELMSKYATYNPEEFAQQEDSAVDIPIFKYATNEADTLPSMEDLWMAAGGKVQDDSAGWTTVATTAPHYDVTFGKSASANEKPAAKMPSDSDIRRAIDNAKQAKFETAWELSEKCASLMQQFTPDNGRWAEAVEDTIFGLGKEAAVAVELVEDYFENHNHKYKGADLTKRAGKNVLARDRHNVWKDMKDICQLVEWQKEAKTLVTELTEALEKKAYLPRPPRGNVSPSPVLPRAHSLASDLQTDIGKTVAEGNPIAFASDIIARPPALELADAIVGPRTHSQDEKVWKAKMMDNTKRDAALQQLLLSDRVLREADPQHVQDLFNTIADISPTLASNPLLMGPTLKEALQYDAIPTQMLKDLVSIEKDQATRKKDMKAIGPDFEL